MSKRITIMIDDDLDRRIRGIQGKKIMATHGSISYSKVINELVRKGVK